MIHYRFGNESILVPCAIYIHVFKQVFYRHKMTSMNNICAWPMSHDIRTVAMSVHEQIVCSNKDVAKQCYAICIDSNLIFIKQNSLQCIQIPCYSYSVQ